jgi:hypothetical protein
MNDRSITATGGAADVHGVDEVRPRRGGRGAARDGAPLGAGAREAARRRDRPDERLPERPLARDGRSRASRHHGRGGVRRRRHGLPRPYRRGRGDQPRVGLHRAQLRRAFQPLREPDPAERHRGAEGALPAEADQRRACGRARHVRGGGGVGRRGHEAPGREAERPLPLNGTKYWITNGPDATRSSSTPRPTPRPGRRGSPPS